MKPYTDITVLMDRSGSMDIIKDSMESALSEFVRKHQENPTTRLTFIQFDDKDDHDVHFKALPIKYVEKITLKPRGWTPLLDAVCKAIDATGHRLADMPESERPDQVLMVIVTDGEENASKTYRRQDVKQRIEKQNGQYKWQFIYLGANQDAYKEAASLGIKPDWTINYKASEAGVHGVYAGLISNTLNYANTTGNARGSSVSSFTKEQREEADTF